MGHTPNFEVSNFSAAASICLSDNGTQHMDSRCGGKIIIIDTGISHAYGGVLSALSIKYTLSPMKGEKTGLWKEREVITALYPDKHTVLVVEEREIQGTFRL